VTGSSTRTYRWHRCGRRHLSGRSFAECAFPIEYSCRGAGQWAVVSDCEARSVSLFQSSAAASHELGRIDGNTCGRNCTFRHELAHLDLVHQRGDVAQAQERRA
jgi:hypothetical protein